MRIAWVPSHHSCEMYTGVGEIVSIEVTLALTFQPATPQSPELIIL